MLTSFQLVYWHRLQPWLSIWGAFWTGLFIIINGFDVFWNFNASDFLTACESFQFSMGHDTATSMTY